MPIFIGDLNQSEYETSEVKKLKHIQETRNLKPGDIVEFFGHAVRWDADCVTEDNCLRWRRVGDPLCDDALQLIFTSPSASAGKDLLECLQQYVSTNPGPNAATIFLGDLNQIPPNSLIASQSQVEAGRRLFLDHAALIMQALLHYSLAAGFASARITRTLHAVSYLVPPHESTSQASSDRIYTRLLETFQFVLDIMGCTPTPPAPSFGSNIEIKPVKEPPQRRAGTLEYLLPRGEGWKSAVRVRMLHGVARRRATERWNKLKMRDAGYDEELDIPISQEDMSATLASFCIIPLWCLHRLGLYPDPMQTEAFLAVWRHVGFYLGVSPSILRRYFTSTSAADKFLASIVLDLFSSDDNAPPDIGPIPTMPILRAISGRPPGNSSLEHNCAVTRCLVGFELADHLGVPETRVITKLKLHATFLLYKIPIWFSWWYPRKQWAVTRREVLSEGMARSVRWNLGMRRTNFRPRGNVIKNEGLDDGQIEELERVIPDPEGGMALVRKWREMLAEMIGVCLGVVCVGLGGLYFGTRMFL
ncbi:unnamed protein product [Somion occarium]|uniref:ER-bound oxygenase mpaB/mpaB'/Rubber oxygenase catalytic domain-containing protein n=1 Tax=Somion occarium TaxID=3059160 RepID=A0ABP1DLT9_9APHY